MASEKERYAELWVRMCRDDLEALEHLYRSLYADLYHYALKLTGLQESAEDAIHDTFVYIWQHRAALGQVESVKFYLLKAVRNQCLLLLRKNSREEALDPSATPPTMRIAPEELELGAVPPPQVRKVRQALQELSPRQAEIIFLKYYNNLDYEEIAELLALNYQSVVNHVFRAISKLRQLMEAAQFRKI
ncbi:MAG: sigma-70 family RNA polymerase sigma factor [Bacteroidetes bacterium]|nr:MAG: sigma-70 family RNA polymerase sigma factor [Bacteroidota bacterium]